MSSRESMIVRRLHREWRQPGVYIVPAPSLSRCEGRGGTGARCSRPVTLFALAIFFGCAKSPTVTTPTPPQLTVAKSVNALAEAVDGAVTAAIAARNQGQVSQADVSSIEAVCKVLAVAGKQIDAELRSSDDWSTQKTKIAGIVSSSGLGAIKPRLSPAAQALVSSLLLVLNQISTAVGGPAI